MLKTRAFPTLAFAALVLTLAAAGPAAAQAVEDDDASTPSTPSTASILAGLELRAIGPALQGGRIADVAVSPADRSTWYVAVGSGGVWKSENAGTTWTPIFDHQGSYSIGCVSVDPTNPSTVWVGTGENVSGRHVGWGDGVYKSLDGGEHWQRMGLERSEHIGKIVVDPEDGDTVWVAAEGPLWSAGGERGVYKTTDGGASWRRVLAIDDDTGATDLEIDPRNPDVLYAAAYERRRHVWSLLAGGDGSGIYKSTDGGESWRRLETGLPEGAMGKIGLAVSPADPDVVYATIEAETEDEQGFYRSRDRGASWERRNGYLSGGTGPHYYQEIEASPHDVDTVYQMDVFLHVTRDGGATFDYLETGRAKHSDNHALVLDPADPEHLIVGTDASLYESFDEGTTWRQIPNLPVSQFYKLSLDSGEPFYHVVGGAQDLGTLLGPTRTRSVEGIRNADWTIPLGADGYDCNFDRGEPDLVYMEWQGGSLVRYDRRSHELLDIKPMPAPGEAPERWNWDSPILVSPHSPTRLYVASQRVWRSDDRGESWTAVSGDLTRGKNRYEMPVMGRVWSVDALYGNTAMSVYGTLSALAESPLAEGLLYAGSDDGLVQVSEDGGSHWRQAGTLPGVPELAFINDLEASRHDAGGVFAAVDAHKTGDFRPLLFESRDRGRTWRSIAGDLPEHTIVWAIAEDPVDPDLLFAGTEYGLYFTPDHGSHWIELTGGVPTIAFRDLEIQPHMNDLVGASFGRGFYVLDDYTPLRQVAAGVLERDAALFPVRDAWWYVPNAPFQAPGRPSLGTTDFAAPNPPFGALFTLFLKEAPKTSREARREAEEARAEAGEDVPFPGWEALREEALETGPALVLTVRNAAGEPVRRIGAPAKAGIQRVAWDLRLPAPDPVELETGAGDFRAPWDTPPTGPLAPPGRYSVEMALRTAAGEQSLGERQEFEVKPLPGSVTPPPDYQEVAAFTAETRELMRQAIGLRNDLGQAQNRLEHLRATLAVTPAADPELPTRLDDIAGSIQDLGTRLGGDEVRQELNEPTVPSILGRLRQITGGLWDTRQAPTQTHKQSLAVVRGELEAARTDLAKLLDEALPAVEDALEEAGAPWTPGRRP
jgi:photosystem II stability/assembly factor-like uncharacterized protein